MIGFLTGGDMRLVCPSCGAMHSAEAFLNDAAARECLSLIINLKGKLPELVLPYLSLFRSRGGGGLRWSKALRLVKELHELVTAEKISWDGKKEYYNHVMYWEAAIEKLIEKPPRQLPVENHNYLRAIAYSVADSTDAREEREREIEKSKRLINDNINYSDEERKKIEELISSVKSKLRRV